MTAPTGQYDGKKLINLGTNRWGFKPEVGVAVPKGRWDFDAYLGVWLFTDNDDFYPGGRRRSQDQVVALQGHASYTFRPRLWAAVDATWYQGGGATVDGGEPAGTHEQLAAGCDRVVSHEPAAVVEVFLQFRRRGPDRDEFQNAQRRVAVAPVHETVVLRGTSR